MILMIDVEEFELWKEHKVTKELYTRLTEAYNEIEEQLHNEVHYTSDGLLVLKRLCGIREALNQVLTLTAEDFIDEDSSAGI